MMHLSAVAPSWNAALDLLRSRSMFVFRGQADYRWPLECTLIREVRRLKRKDAVNIRNREAWLLYQFQRLAHHHISDPPAASNALDWLSIIQHHGGPTRLIDFTHSPLVAAFFAIDSAVGDAAIWAVRFDEYVLQIKKIIPTWQNGTIIDVNRAYNARFNEAIASGTVERLVLPVEPERLHQRLWLQQGLFLAQLDLTSTFTENLAATFPSWQSSLGHEPAEIAWKDLTDAWSGLDRKAALIRIVIPTSLHEDIRESLAEANMTAATLFPGLDGLARSLKSRI